MYDIWFTLNHFEFSSYIGRQHFHFLNLKIDF